jgi:transcriptional regulator GlxA family with amidase domain
VQVAIVTLDGFNEIDSFVANSIINRAKGIRAYITTPTPTVTSLNGVEATGQRPLEFTAEADVVLIGSGSKTVEHVRDTDLMARLALDPERQWIGSQCSGALVLARLGLVDGRPVCADATSRPFAEAAGLTVLDQAFHSEGRIATAGGCLAAQYLAAWTLLRTVGEGEVRRALDYVAPVGEENATVERALKAVG